MLGSGPMNSFNPTRALGYGWKVVIKDFVAVGLPIVVALIISALPGIPFSGAGGFVQGLGQAAAQNGDNATIYLLIAAALRIVGSIISLLMGAYIGAGILNFALQVARGQRPSFGVVFSGGRWFLSMLGLQIVLGIAVSFGFLLCLLPGIYLALRFAVAQAVVVDENLGPIDAMKRSWELTGAAWVQILLLGMLAILVTLAGFLACCVGVFVTAPVLMLASVYMYLTLKGQEPPMPA
jgi:hypothetical protein